MRLQLSMVGDNWAVTMGRDGAGWLIEDATRIARNGRVEAVESQPLGKKRFSTRSDALTASTTWLRGQGLLPELAQ